jgi:dolichyl-phosphate-mannose-protein mannosyltransferase
MGISKYVSRLVTAAVRYLPILIGIAYLGLCLSVLIPVDVFERDFDEGIQLMKAALLERGYKLYSDIWSDQPPLFTYLLSHIFYIFGDSVQLARFIVTICAAVLVALLAALCQGISGWPAALVLVILTIASEHFLRLSVSSMIGIPALGFAVISIVYFERYLSSGRVSAMVLSSLALGASLATKMFTLPIAGAIAATLAFKWAMTSSRKFLVAGVIWGLLVACQLVATFVAFGVDWQQVVGTHRSARGTIIFSLQGMPAVVEFLEGNSILVAAACLSSLFFVTRKDDRVLLPALWFLAAMVGMVGHAPVFYHQTLLLSIPLCWLAAIGLGRLIDTDAWRIKRDKPMLIALAVAGLLLIVQIPSNIKATYREAIGIQCTECPEIIHFLRSNTASETWMITDRPMFAFRAVIPVPPNTAVWSAKRRNTKQLMDEDIVAAKNKYPIGMVLMNREPWSCEFIKKHFEGGYYQSFSNHIGSFPYSNEKPLATVLTKKKELAVKEGEIPCD